METTVTSFDERAKEREKRRENGGGDDDDELDDEDDVEDEEDEEARLEEEINAAALQDSNQLIIGSIAERMGVSMNEAEDDEEGDGGGDGVQTQQPQPQQILSAGHLLNNIAIVSSQQQPKGQQQPMVTPTSGKSTRTLLAPPVPPLQIQPPGTPSTVDDPRQITVTWRDLTYTVEGRTMTLRSLCASADDLEEAGEGRLTLVRHTKRTILKGVNGHFATGQLTAVMGPSGSGKSTMLECIVGFRKRGLTGDIRVASGGGSKGDQNSGEKMIKMALISQSDYLIESFTVREMLVYASRLKNWRKEDEEEARLMKVVVEKDSEQMEGGKSSSKRNLLDDVEEGGGGGGGGGGKVVKNVHQKLALSVCAQLGLDVCIDTRAGSCSGGQKKRISIALEMISK